MNANGKYQVKDKDRHIIANLIPAIEAAETEKLVQCLVHLTKYYGIQYLNNPDSTWDDKLTVKLTEHSAQTPLPPPVPPINDDHTPRSSATGSQEATSEYRVTIFFVSPLPFPEVSPFMGLSVLSPASAAHPSPSQISLHLEYRGLCDGPPTTIPGFAKKPTSSNCPITPI